MKKLYRDWKSTAALGLLIGLCSAAVIDAQNAQMGQAQFAAGSLVVVRPDGIEDRLRGKGALSLFEHDVVRTAQGDRGLLELGDLTRIGVNENSLLQLLSRWEKSTGTTRIVRLKKGQIWVKAAGSKSIEIETASGTVVVANAEVDIKVSEDGQSILSVAQGSVPFATSNGWCTVTVSMMSSAAPGRGCSSNAKINPQEIFAWNRDLIK
jgi:ferric-dicitrate binding protein FerR (iron transport regulator)